MGFYNARSGRDDENGNGRAEECGMCTKSVRIGWMIEDVKM